MKTNFGTSCGLPALSLLAVLSAFSAPAQSAEKTCVYISSYHKGYAWSDGVERGLRDVLDSHCRIVQYDMDTKRKKSMDDKLAAAQQALDVIAKESPDIVITSDDNAAKYLIVPHLKDKELPVVFLGVNWTVEEYGFPFTNVTGMVEVAPIDPMLKQGQTLSDGGTNAIYLGADTLTEKKNWSRFIESADRRNISVDSRFSATMEDWVSAFKEAQEYDFIIMGSNSGVENWNTDLAQRVTREYGVIPSLTNHEWMMPFTLLGYTKIPEEQGEWAAQSAIAILDGMSPTDIPLVTNRKWESWANLDLLNDDTSAQLSRFLRRAKKVRQEVNTAELK